MRELRYELETLCSCYPRSAIIVYVIGVAMGLIFGLLVI